MLGYFATSDQALTADGWLRTGDSATMDAQGYLRIAGRLKDMIIRGGENIYPREIEEVLYKHPGVAEAAVVGVPSERMGEEVAAFLRPAPGASIDRDALFAYLREHLSPQKTPRYWYAVDAYPLTGSGKIQKFVLRKQWEEGAFSEL
jgi:fatty-acyl-CoA synthase